MRYFELLLLAVIGIICCYMGWRIWKKEQITLIHDYHYTKVKEKDKKPYTKRMGQALILMGAGMALTGIVDFVTFSMCGWIIFGVSFCVGLVMMVRAQMKYNHGIF